MGARDKHLRLYIKAIGQRILRDESDLTDFQKKDIEKRLALLSKKVEEMARSQDVQGLARVIHGSSFDQKLKYFYVLFHGGEQLFLTVTGKGRKIGMEGEWLAKVEVVEAMGAFSGDQLWMEELAAARGLPLMSWASALNRPIAGDYKEFR